MTELDQLRKELESARSSAAYWEREAVLRAVAISGALFNQIALARALARNIEAHLDGSGDTSRVQRSLAAFWRAGGEGGAGPRADA